MRFSLDDLDPFPGLLEVLQRSWGSPETGAASREGVSCLRLTRKNGVLPGAAGGVRGDAGHHAQEDGRRFLRLHAAALLFYRPLLRTPAPRLRAANLRVM